MNPKSKLLHIALFIGIATSLPAGATSNEHKKEPAVAARADAYGDTGHSRKNEEKTTPASQQKEKATRAGQQKEKATPADFFLKALSQESGA